MPCSLTKTHNFKALQDRLMRSNSAAQNSSCLASNRASLCQDGIASAPPHSRHTPGAAAPPASRCARPRRTHTHCPACRARPRGRPARAARCPGPSRSPQTACPAPSQMGVIYLIDGVIPEVCSQHTQSCEAQQVLRQLMLQGLPVCTACYQCVAKTLACSGQNKRKL